MQLLIIFASLLATSWAENYLYPAPSQQLQTPIVIVKNIKEMQHQNQQIQQYFTQDSYGQYSYGYSEPLSSKQEVRTLDGITRGFYSYVDANGILQTVDYTADAEGFHVAATNLPMDTQKAVTETPEVALAREQHLAAHKAIMKGDISASSILPQPVQDTPEVAAAKKDFLARYAAEEKKLKFLQKSIPLKGLSSTSQPTTYAVPQLSGIRSTGAPTSSIRYPAQTSIIKTPNTAYLYGIPVQLQRYYLPVV